MESSSTASSWYKYRLILFKFQAHIKNHRRNYFHSILVWDGSHDIETTRKFYKTVYGRRRSYARTHYIWAYIKGRVTQKCWAGDTKGEKMELKYLEKESRRLSTKTNIEDIDSKPLPR